MIVRVSLRRSGRGGFTVTSKYRYENGYKLIWPIMRSKSVDRIVVHHTAEDIKQDADDMTVLRAMYAYHARTRGR